MTEIPENLANSLKNLKEMYKKRIAENIGYYEDLLGKSLDKEILTDLRMNVHKLSGSAGIYGFSNLCQATHEFDIELQDMLNGVATIPEHVIKAKIRGIITIMDVDKEE